VLRLDLSTERWPLTEPFAIAREVMHEVPVIVATISDGAGNQGRGEAAGVDYDGETPASMTAQLEALGARLHTGADAEALCRGLPPGGARNALDCALWDLRAKQSGVPVWRAAGLDEPRPLVSAATIGLGDDAFVRRRARALRQQALVKIKVDAQRHLGPVRAVREELPQARLIVDANQAWTPELLGLLLPQLAAIGVELLEQPLPRGGDEALAAMTPPIPIAADESCTDADSLVALAGRYQAANIKLDKCGGFTEALHLARAAQARGLQIMVGNMCGSSLAMAPAFHVAARFARWADLDGPLLQRGDRAAAMRYDPDGLVHPPSSALWG
jgi:L-alanine-DL-glutamate epimerase-like enolase superfamily enzyme